MIRVASALVSGVSRLFRAACPAFLLVAVTILSAGLALVARAADAAPATVIIVDSSGSMAAREPDGRVRLDAARESIVDALGAWPVGADVAVVAYGHRRTSDCSDIETIVPLGPLSIDDVKRKLTELRARGKTPLSESLRRAAGLLPSGGGDIVLVSDGIETCDVDPCALARDLTAANANITIHVVGFGVAGDARAQLKCIAEDGGGRYFGAADAGELASALGEVAAVVKLPAPPPARVLTPSSEPTLPPTPRQVSLTATAGALGQIVDAPVAWVVTAFPGEIVYEGASRGLGLSLLPGRYSVSALATNATGATEIVVSDEDKLQAFVVEVTAGRLDLALAASPKAEPYDDLETNGVVWGIEPLDGQPPAQIEALAKPSLLLARGRYRVSAQLQGMAAEDTVEVVPGEPVALVLNFQLGSLILEAALAAEGPTIEDDRAFKWGVGGGDTKTVIDSQSRPRLTLRAGSYPVVLRIAGFELTTEAEVVAGEERIQRLVVKSGELNLAARLGPKAGLLDDWRDTTWTISAVSALGFSAGTPATDAPLVEAMPRLTLLPGVWHIALESGIAHIEQDVTVAPETATDVVVDVGAARLTLLATPATGEPPINIVYAAYPFDVDGTPTEEAAFTTGSSGDASVILPAGRWRVTALDDAQRSAEADVDLAAGDELTLEMSLK